MREKTFGAKAKLLVQLFAVFFKIGATTFGGGIAMLPFMERELIEKRHWMTSDELLTYIVIGQSTPGIIAVNVSTFVGYKMAGVLGGIVGTLGITAPSLAIIMVIATFISNIASYPLVQKALKGVNVAVSSLLFCTAISFFKKTVKSLLALVEVVAAFVLVYVLNFPAIFVIIAAITAGCILTAVKLKKK